MPVDGGFQEKVGYKWEARSVVAKATMSAIIKLATVTDELAMCVPRVVPRSCRSEGTDERVLRCTLRGACGAQLIWLSRRKLVTRVDEPMMRRVTSGARCIVARVTMSALMKLAKEIDELGSRDKFVENNALSLPWLS